MAGKCPRPEYSYLFRLITIQDQDRGFCFLFVLLTGYWLEWIEVVARAES